MRYSIASVVIGGLSVVGISGSSGSAAPVFTSTGAYEAESFYTGSGIVLSDPEASGNAYVRPTDGGSFVVEFYLEPEETGAFDIGVGYRSEQGCVVTLEHGSETRMVALPAAASFLEMAIDTVTIEGGEHFSMTFTGDIDVDYTCAQVVVAGCGGCEVDIDDTILTDPGGTGTEHGGTFDPSKFNNGSHKFQPNSVGGYDCTGEVDPISDDVGNGGVAVGTGAAAGGGILLVGAGETAAAAFLASNPVGWAVAGSIVVGGTAYTILEWLGESSNGVNFRIASWSLKAKRGNCSGSDCSAVSGCKLILTMVLSMPDANMAGPDGETEILTTTGGAWSGNHDEKSAGVLKPGNGTVVVNINETAVEDCNDDDGYILLEWGDGDDIMQIDFDCTKCVRIL